MIPPPILHAYNLNLDDFQIERISAGYINQTFKLNGLSSFILQRLNKNVFQRPDVVAKNIRMAAAHLHLHHPEYLFPGCLRTTNGSEMHYDDDGFPWRLFPYITNTFTVNEVDSEQQAYAAASGFARLTRKLSACDPSSFEPTIDKFHDLVWRYQQFEEALAHASDERKLEAFNAISDCVRFKSLVTRFHTLIKSGQLSLRIFHNDTKINNILFDKLTGKDVCVIDLDTLMPGYFIYDLGDMLRTFVSPVDEEEKDTTKIIIRKNIYDAVLAGYLSEMNDVLTVSEKNCIPFAGLMMTYIMALRMITDFLNGDVYYHTTYPKQNLIRAKNQLHLLHLLSAFTG